MLLVVFLELQDDSLLLVLKLERVVPNDEASVLLRAQLAISPDSNLSLLLVLLELRDCSLHLLQAHVELFDLVSVASLALVPIRQVTLHIVLVQLHQARDVLVLVLRVHDLLDVLLELENNGFLVLRLFLLICYLNANLVDFTLHLAQALRVPLQRAALVFEVFLELEQLVLQVVNLLFFWLQTLLHLFGSVRQYMP